MRTACSPPMRLRHLCAYARQHLSRELSSSLLLLLALQLPRHAQTPQATCTAQCSQSCAARLFTMCLSSSEVTKAIPPSRSNILLTLRPAEYHGCCIPAIIEHAWTLRRTAVRVRRRGIATGGRRGTATEEEQEGSGSSSWSWRQVELSALHPPPPPREAGQRGTRGGVRFLFARPRPLQPY